MSNEDSNPSRSQPDAVIWFKLYAAILCIMYTGVASISLIFFLSDPEAMDMSAAMANGIGVAFLLLGLVLFGLTFIALLLKPRPWLWIYNLIIICLGMSNVLLLPFCIPLLIFWLKPKVKQYYEYSTVPKG